MTEYWMLWLICTWEIYKSLYLYIACVFCWAHFSSRVRRAHVSARILPAKGEKHHPDCYQWKVQKPATVMVFISVHGMGDLHICEGTIDAEAYVGILERRITKSNKRKGDVTQCPTFFRVCCKHQFLNLFIFNKYLSWSVKTLKIFSLSFCLLNKGSSELTNYRFLFLENVPTLMEMGFVVLHIFLFFFIDTCAMTPSLLCQVTYKFARSQSCG